MAPGGEENPVQTITEDVGTGGQPPNANPCYGTSVSAAYVSGMLALLKSDSRHARQNRGDFLSAVKNDRCKLPAHVTSSRKPDPEYGFGIIRYEPRPEDEKEEAGEEEAGYRIESTIEEVTIITPGSSLRVPMTRG